MSDKNSTPAAGPGTGDYLQDEVNFDACYHTAAGMADLMRMAGDSEAELCADTLSNVGIGLLDVLKRMKSVFEHRTILRSGCPPAIERALSSTGWARSGERWVHAVAPDATFEWPEAVVIAITAAGRE